MSNYKIILEKVPKVGNAGKIFAFHYDKSQFLSYDFLCNLIMPKLASTLKRLKNQNKKV